MRRSSYFLAILLFTLTFALPASAVNVFQRYDRVIWIDQPRQSGAAYEKGRKLFSFPIMTGDDETPTPPGAYIIKRKDENYYSRKYKQPMPYSLFFDLKGMRAIHEGAVPDPSEMGKWATHGCIHVEEPYMERLFDWAVAGKTLVVVRGRRDWALEDQIGQVDEGIQENQDDQDNQDNQKEDQESQQEDQEDQDNQGIQERRNSPGSEDEPSSGPESAPGQQAE